MQPPSRYPAAASFHSLWGCRDAGWAEVDRLSVIRLPPSRLPFLLVRLGGHTPSSVSGVSRSLKNAVDLTGCLADMV